MTAEQAAATMRSKRYVVLLLIVAVVGVLVSFATWGFLELIYQLSRELYTHLPHALGYQHGPPLWWPVPILGIAGLIVALAIARLPGNGGHVPAMGLSAGEPTPPVQIPGIVLAGLVGIGAGAVLGPEAPLIALGGGGAVLLINLARRDTPPQVAQIVGAAGAFAAVSFLFASPLIAAVILIEATGIGGPRLPLVVIPGLLSAGIGTLLAVGLGSWTGLNRSDIALGPLQHLPAFSHPTIAQFGWTIALATGVAIIAWFCMKGGRVTYRFTAPRPLVLLPLIGLAAAGLAILFSQLAGKNLENVLFSGESGLPTVVAQAGSWSLSALALLIVFKGLAYGLSLGSFRGGPTFPAVFLGAAGGIMASHLPGFPLTPAIAVGMAAAVASVLRLPLSAVVLGTLMTASAGVGDEPLIIVGVVVAYVVTLALSAVRWRQEKAETEPELEAAHAATAVSGG